MEENLKKQIALLLKGELPILSQKELLMRLAVDSEACAYFNKISSEADPEIQQTIIENMRTAFANELLDEYGEFIPAIKPWPAASS